MSNILKKYEESTAPSVVDARNQSDGQVAVDWYPNDFQNNFTTREKGNTLIPLSNVDDDTTGNFTEDALEHYEQEHTELAGDHHKYNRSDSESHYVTKNSATPGIIYQATITEK